MSFTLTLREIGSGKKKIHQQYLPHESVWRTPRYGEPYGFGGIQVCAINCGNDR